MPTFYIPCQNLFYSYVCALVMVFPMWQVRLLMVSRMAKPEEVLVVENDQGEVVREFMKDTDSINLYKNMRETLGEQSIELEIESPHHANEWQHDGIFPVHDF